MEILFSNKDIAVVLKPVGLGSEQEVPAAIISALGGEVFPIHRLDKNVGGCMVYARSKKAAAALSRAVQEGQMQKEYVALVHGVPPEQGDWQDLLWKDSSKNKVFVVQRQRKGVKDARLEFTRLSCADPSLVRILLHTGRSHQIRVQFASRGYPLWGERKYSTLDDPCEIALFSQKIGFFHPKTGEWMEFRHEPPSAFPWDCFQ